MRTLTLVLLVLTVYQAQAFECRYYRDHTELEIHDMQDTKVVGACADGAEKPLVVYFTSNGGNIDIIRKVVGRFRKAATVAQKISGYIPTFAIKEECSSACIPILSGLNQLAGDHLLHLVVDRSTKLGFHGCSDIFEDDPNPHFSVRGTKRYLGYWKGLGGSTEWMEANKDLFQGPEVTPFKPEDRRLDNSGIFTNAEIVDLGSYRLAFQISPLDNLKVSISN